MERIYSGERTESVSAVQVDGRPLSEWLDLRTYTSRGFDWSTDNARATQLALAILADYYSQWGLEHAALSLAEDFRDLVVCWLPYDTWELGEAEVAAALRAILRERGARSNAAPVGVLV